MVTKYKAAVFIIAAMFSSISSAAYTTMTIDAVKESNGVWTAAGVMDTQGFVRTTGAVSVMGATRNLPVTLTADAVAAGALVRTAARLAGPVALAASAYDLYQWATTGGVTASADGKWVDADSTVYEFGSYFSTLTNPAFTGSTPEAAANNYFNRNEPGNYAPAKCTVSTSTSFLCESYPLANINAKQRVNSNKAKCTSSQLNLKSCGDPVYSTSASFDKLPALTTSLLASGFNNIPSLKGQPIPIKSTSFTPFSEWSGDPYFKDGSWYRDRMDISPCPTSSQPTRVCVDIGPQKFEGATDPQTVPSQATGTASGGAPKQQETDFCKKNPQSIACSELGSLKDENLPVEERPVNVGYTPWGSSSAQCPSDKVIPLWDDRSFTISYSPVCQFANLLRPLVIALAFLTAGFIVAGITRKGGGDS